MSYCLLTGMQSIYTRASLCSYGKVPNKTIFANSISLTLVILFLETAINFNYTVISSSLTTLFNIVLVVMAIMFVELNVISYI